MFVNFLQSELSEFYKLLVLYNNVFVNAVILHLHAVVRNKLFYILHVVLQFIGLLIVHYWVRCFCKVSVCHKGKREQKKQNNTSCNSKCRQSIAMMLTVHDTIVKLLALRDECLVLCYTLQLNHPLPSGLLYCTFQSHL